MKHELYILKWFTSELVNGIANSRLELIVPDHLFILKEPGPIIQSALSFLSEVASMHERKRQ